MGSDGKAPRWESVVEPGADPLEGMIEQLAVENAKLRGEIEELLGVARRAQAELSSVRERLKREYDLKEKLAAEAIARELMPALDGVAKSMEAVAKAGGTPAMVEALGLIERELLRGLSRGGIRPIETRGRKFDPAVHEAVAMVESAEHEDGAVVSEARRGYMIHDRVLRPAQVTVARRSAGGAHAAKTDAEGGGKA
jgi:molecular chaperone GrpE